MSFIKKQGKYYLLFIVLIFFVDTYYFFLMREQDVQYLIYLNMLLAFVLIPFFLRDKKRYLENEKEENANREEMNQQLAKYSESNAELQDYIAKWCHEYKIPLAATMLLVEKIDDVQVRMAMKEQLERMSKQTNSMLLGCKMQSNMLDLQIKKTSLKECIRASVKNNQFFLIQKGFAIQIDVEEYVYTDPMWLTYVLDQMIDNAIKYSTENPMIHFWTKRESEKILLYVEDRGEGIQQEDVRRIFEKGYTGKNQHNGKYKSTGFGLYMAKKILNKLNHTVSVSSEYNEYTRFGIEFRYHDYFLQEL